MPVPGGHLHVLEEIFGAGSGFLASKLGTVVFIPQRITEMQEGQGTWRDKNVQVSLATFSIYHSAGGFYVKGNKENSYFSTHVRKLSSM